MTVHLIATDLDGTLLRADRTVSPRTLDSLRRAAAAGLSIVPATARQPHGIRGVAPVFVNLAAGLGGWALCSNGALCINLTDDEVLFAATMTPTVLSGLVERLATEIPGTVIAVVADAGRTFCAEDGYAQLATWTDHHRDPATMQRVSRAELASIEALKVVARHPQIPARELLDRITRLDIGGTSATWSGAPFVEIAAAGIGKAWGLQRLSEHLGFTADEVLAIGDGLNDLDMLAWAGRSVAVANAEPAVLAIVDEITAGCDDDGVARIVDSVLDQRDTITDEP